MRSRDSALRLTSQERHRRRMARYDACPSATCAACSKRIQRGHKRTYQAIDLPTAVTIAFHPKCDDKPVRLSRAVVDEGLDLAIYKNANDLLLALDHREHLDGPSAGLDRLRSAVRRVVSFTRRKRLRRR